MPAHNLRLSTLVLTIMIVIDAISRPLILALVWLAPATFNTYVAPIATTVDGSVIAFKFLTMIVFCRWIYVAGRNLVEAGMDELDFTPASRIWWFIVPVASLFKPFQGMRELWNASRNIWPHGTNETLVSVWWGLWLLNGVVGYFVAVMDEGRSSLTGIMISSAVGVVVAAVAIVMIRGIARGQEQFAGSELSEVFA